MSKRKSLSIVLKQINRYVLSINRQALQCLAFFTSQVIVEEMKVRGEENQVGFEAFAKECDLYIGVIRRNRRETDDMAKQLNTRSKRIEEEKFECQELVIEADNDLQEAMPAMNAAVEV